MTFIAFTRLHVVVRLVILGVAFQSLFRTNLCRVCEGNFRCFITNETINCKKSVIILLIVLKGHSAKDTISGFIIFSENLLDKHLFLLQEDLVSLNLIHDFFNHNKMLLKF